MIVDLGRIAANWRRLQKEAGAAACAAVVKADAYGLGMANIAPALAAAGCTTFFVAHLAEGLGHLQAQPAGSSGDERNLATQVEEIADAHFARVTLDFLLVGQQLTPVD